MAAVALVAGLGGYYLAMYLERSNSTGTYSVDPPVVSAAEDLVGQRRPDFTLNDARGIPVSADDFDGRILLVNFWATWCAPCVEELPMLSSLQQEFAGEGVQFIGIALDDARRAREFAERLGVVYPVLVGQSDVAITGRRFGNATGMLPFSVLVDSLGIVRWTHLGALSREELKTRIQHLQ